MCIPMWMLLYPGYYFLASYKKYPFGTCEKFRVLLYLSVAFNQHPNTNQLVILISRSPACKLPSIERTDQCWEWYDAQTKLRRACPTVQWEDHRLEQEVFCPLMEYNPKTLYVAELLKSTPESIKILTSTFGQIARYVYYGNPNIVKWNAIFYMYIYSSKTQDTNYVLQHVTVGYFHLQIHKISP